MNTIVDTYLRTWNTTDAVARAELLTQHWVEDACYVDPLAEVAGRDGIGAAIEAVQAQFPGFVFSRVGEPDSHHNQTRFQWGLGPEGAEPVVIGFDVVVTNDEGRIASVHGFLDKVPA